MLKSRSPSFPEGLHLASFSTRPIVAFLPSLEPEVEQWETDVFQQLGVRKAPSPQFLPNIAVPRSSAHLAITQARLRFRPPPSPTAGSRTENPEALPAPASPPRRNRSEKRGPGRREKSEALAAR
ncbi:hypothetical protein JRQ81_012657 [Phrynocephalus forsythii]|uniref:Uncharacterized protein n=1 Tax=Phrynocephalus forsythii TaxID=171643 RepID=A0A9Q0Y1J7_9SAUR|nr:hypothetical protein JRQ81_012657 [Phrynocephalus forsythii]